MSSLQGLVSLHTRNVLAGVVSIAVSVAGGGPTMSGTAIAKMVLEILDLHELGFALDVHVRLHGNSQAHDFSAALSMTENPSHRFLIEPSLNKKSNRSPAKTSSPVHRQLEEQVARSCRACHPDRGMSRG